MNIINHMLNCDVVNFFDQRSSFFTRRDVDNEKDSVVAIFRACTQEMNQLKTQRIPQSEINEAKRFANQKFALVYHKANFPTRIFWNILGVFGASLVGSHRQLLKQLDLKTFENYRLRGSYFDVQENPQMTKRVVARKNQFTQNLIPKSVQKLVWRRD